MNDPGGVFAVMSINRLWYVMCKPKAFGCHTREQTSDNFPPARDGQNKLAYNVWYARPAPSWCWCHPRNSAALSCLQHICKHITTKLIVLLQQALPVLEREEGCHCVVLLLTIKAFEFNFSVCCALGLSMFASLRQEHVHRKHFSFYKENKFCCAEILVLKSGFGLYLWTTA